MINNYIEGLEMNQFRHIVEISCYNNNYYQGIGSDLLFGKSDDDNETKWYLVDSDLKKFIFIGYSYTTGGEILRKFLH